MAHMMLYYLMRSLEAHIQLSTCVCVGWTQKMQRRRRSLQHMVRRLTAIHANVHGAKRRLSLRLDHRASLHHNRIQHTHSSRQVTSSSLYHSLFGPRGSAVERQSLASVLLLSCARPVADR